MKSLVDITRPIQKLNIISNILIEDGPFPNNALLPLLLYRHACRMDGNSDDIIRELLETNSWGSTWIDGIYNEHHFHTTTHEVLVAMSGSARVQFGGPNGVTLDFEKGDVVIIPAGVAHCRVDAAPGFSCMGAYPQGQTYDMNYGKDGERSKADQNIRRVPLPEGDPIYGSDGPLVKNWFSEQDKNPDML